MWILLFSVITILVGTWIAVKVSKIQGNRVISGCWFGVLAILANTLSTDVGDLHISVGLIDAPPIIAAFFFSPVSGIIAGIIAAVERSLTPLWGVGGESWAVCAMATLLVSLYAAALAKWVFLERRPPVITAGIATAFGEMLHLAIIYIMGYRDLPRTLEIFYAAVIPMVAGSGVAVGLAAFPCGSWRQAKNRFFRSLTLAFFAFGLAFGVIAVNTKRNAARHTDELVDEALKDLEKAIDEEIGFILHSNGVLIAAQLNHAHQVSVEEIRRIARAYDVDELNVKNDDGEALASTDLQVLHGSGKNFRSSIASSPYFDITSGRSTFIQQQFRPGINNPEVVAKYVGVAFPQGGGFLQLGYTWEHLGRRFAEFFFPMFGKAQIGKTGYFLVADPHGRLIAAVHGHPEAAGKTLTEIGFKKEHLIIDPGKLFYDRVFGVWCRCSRFKRIGNYRIYAVLPIAEFHAPAVQNLFLSGFMLFAFCIIFRLILYRFQMAQKKIDDLRAAEEKRRQEDLDLAHTIQSSELREDDPDTPNYRVNASMTPAKEVGGDFYDYLELPDGRLLIAIADVSGKGIPAAIFMMKAKAVLHACAYRSPLLSDIAQTLNEHLATHNEAMMFVTAWLGIFDPKSGHLEYVCAGHNPPLVKRADGSVAWLPGTRSLALAVLETAQFTPAELQLHPGDTLCLYTDGVTEAVNASEDLFGEARLEEAVRQAQGPLLPAIHAALADFIADAPQSDDITMLTLEYKQPGENGR